MQYAVFLFLAPIAFFICGIVLFAIARSWRASSQDLLGRALFLYLVVIVGFLVTNTCELLAPTAEATLFLAQFDYLFIAFAPVTWFAFVLAYTGRGRWLAPRRFWPFCISPMITNLLVWTNDLHGLVWQHFSFKPAGPFLALRVGAYGGWFWIHTIYSYSLFLVGAVLVVVAFVRSQRIYRRQAAWVLAGALLPLLVNLVYIFRLVPGLQKDFSPVTFAMAGLAFAIGIFRYRLLDLVPLPRAVLVEELEGGVIVLDQDERIVDLNPAARRVLNLPGEDGIGQQASALLPFWGEITAQSRGERDRPAEWCFEVNGVEHVFELHISPLPGQGRRLVTLMDITRRKRAQQELERGIRERTAELRALNATLEERVARRTRELAVLYAVSSVASEVQDLDSLLSRSLARVMASLESDAGAVYLLDGDAEKDLPSRLRPAVTQAGSPTALQQIRVEVENGRLAEWVIEHGEPRLVPNGQDETVSGEFTRHFALLVVPMRAEGEAVGVMALSRLAEPLFNLEEVALLSTVADQVGVAVAAARLREMAKQAQVLAERQKVAADLHDSITQSLYGLVAFCEAGHVQIERGDLAGVEQTMSRVTAEARQALREMRLFLHELRPSVLETEGLMGALHQRLAAVEGRSDVRARLLADESLRLPLEQEEALYRIAQEALNNTLRHARASTVTVYLGREGDQALLEVYDDGCGFDPQEAGEGRMGLANMRARAAAVGGELKVRSQPGLGTRVRVTVPLSS